MSENIWRFPGNNYTAESGLDTADMETFKKDPISSLARELCQNSIDARLSKKEPVTVQFKSFKINREDIPGIDRLSKEINSCSEEWKNHHKISKELEKMKESISNNEIDCLRISDYNTKGLEGVGSDRKGSFYLLTKGSGISDKTGTSGGSKGIGKFATFVASEFNTVFYNTYTFENEVGYQGISKLCSTTMENSDQKTQGIGYFGKDEKNHPVLEQLSLEPNYMRHEYGTDVYIIGFRKEASWMSEIVTKILDSFMAAIIFKDLEIKIQNIDINHKTIGEIVYSDNLILKSIKKDIISQYELLTDDKVKKEIISIEDYGEAKLFVKGYSKGDMEFATNNCIMIRYPYMKIKTIKNVSSIPCSAMCIIDNNRLNSILRDIENPQHTDWEIKRIHDISKKREVKTIIKKLRKSIRDIIAEFLSSSENEKTDIEGASDYLPASGDSNFNEEQFIISENPEIIKQKKNKSVDDVGYTEDEKGESLAPEIGSLDDGEGSPKPEGENDGSSGNPHETDGEGEPNEGDKDILIYTHLSGIKCRFYVLSKNKGQYAVTFTSPLDEEDCELRVYYVDEGGSKYQVNILGASINNNIIEVKENKINFSLFKNKVYSFVINTDQDELFAGEVRIYARR